MQRDTLDATEMKVYDMVCAAGEHGIGLGTVVAKLGSGGRTSSAIATLLKDGAIVREACRLFIQ
jgi:hypothetical protein